MEAFALARPKLEKQYENIVYAVDSGEEPSKIRRQLENHRQAHPEEPRILCKAFALELLLTKARVAVETETYFPGKIEHSGLMSELKMAWGTRAMEEEFHGHWTDWIRDGVISIVDMSHTSPDWQAVLTLGFPGLEKRAAAGNSLLHRAARQVYSAARVFCRRLGERTANPSVSALAERPPQTLQEAFALAYLFHNLQELEGEPVRTMGWFDRLYGEFYERDIATGRLNRDSAKELIKYFWIAFYAEHQGKGFGKNFCFGPKINALSRLGMEVYYEMNTVDPKLSVRYTPDMPKDFLNLVLRNIRDGRTGIVFLNEAEVIAGLIKHGRSPEDAAHYIPIGCYEPAVMGKEISRSGATQIILAKIVEIFMQEKTEYASFAAFKAGFLTLLKKQIMEMMEKEKRCEKIWPEINPAPLLSGTFADCLSKGLDISDGGAKYNSTGCVVAHLADAVDSLAAVKDLVYDRKICSLAELRVALAADFAGYEKLRLQGANRSPKWGNNHCEADALAVEITTLCARLLNHESNTLGGHFFASLYGQHVVERGKYVGALPSGRKAGEALSKNMDAALSMDRNGVTSLLNSALKIDVTDYPCGVCLDVMLHPSAVAGSDGLEALRALVVTYMAGGGSGLQFNIFDSEALRDAQIHPEHYRNLQVRVCGWNARFTDLSTADQNTFIRQAEAVAG